MEKSKELFKCHKCKQYVHSSEVVKFDINIKGKKPSIKKFHSECLNQFKEARVETEKWNKVYDFMRYELLGYAPDMQLPSFARNRLLGLRNGTYGLKRGDKINGQSYTWDIIYMTMVLKKMDIVQSLRSKAFEDEQHKINYMFAIISSSINDVYMRDKNRKVNEINLKQSVENVSETFVIQQKPMEKRNKSTSKVANKLKHLI